MKQVDSLGLKKWGSKAYKEKRSLFKDETLMFSANINVTKEWTILQLLMVAYEKYFDAYAVSTVVTLP